MSTDKLQEAAEANPFTEAYLISKKIFYLDRTSGLREHSIQQGAEKILSFAKSYALSLVENKWVSVEERLPEAETGVLTIERSGFMSVAWIDGDIGGWVDNITGHAKGITHWQPLPKSPF